MKNVDRQNTSIACSIFGLFSVGYSLYRWRTKGLDARTYTAGLTGLAALATAIGLWKANSTPKLTLEEMKSQLRQAALDHDLNVDEAWKDRPGTPPELIQKLGWTSEDLRQIAGDFEKQIETEFTEALNQKDGPALVALYRRAFSCFPDTIRPYVEFIPKSRAESFAKSLLYPLYEEYTRLNDQLNYELIRQGLLGPMIPLLMTHLGQSEDYVVHDLKSRALERVIPGFQNWLLIFDWQPLTTASQSLLTDDEKRHLNLSPERLSQSFAWSLSWYMETNDAKGCIEAQNKISNGIIARDSDVWVGDVNVNPIGNNGQRLIWLQVKQTMREQTEDLSKVGVSIVIDLTYVRGDFKLVDAHPTRNTPTWHFVRRELATRLIKNDLDLDRACADAKIPTKGLLEALDLRMENLKIPHHLYSNGN